MGLAFCIHDENIIFLPDTRLGNRVYFEQEKKARFLSLKTPV